MDIIELLLRLQPLVKFVFLYATAVYILFVLFNDAYCIELGVYLARTLLRVKGPRLLIRIFDIAFLLVILYFFVSVAFDAVELALSMAEYLLEQCIGIAATGAFESLFGLQFGVWLHPQLPWAHRAGLFSSSHFLSLPLGAYGRTKFNLARSYDAVFGIFVG